MEIRHCVLEAILSLFICMTEYSISCRITVLSVHCFDIVGCWEGLGIPAALILKETLLVVGKG